MGIGSSKTIELQVPAYDMKLSSLELLPKTKLTLSRRTWVEILGQCELSGFKDERTGQSVFRYSDLVPGASVGIPKGAAATLARLQNFEGENRSRINATEQELEGLIDLIASEEAVPASGVVLMPELRQIVDPSSSPTVKLEVDLVAHVPTKKLFYIGSYKLKASDVVPITELENLMETYDDLSQDSSYSNLQVMQGSNFKGVLIAEVYATTPAGLTRLKAKAARRNILLVRRNGNNIAKAQSIRSVARL